MGGLLDTTRTQEYIVEVIILFWILQVSRKKKGGGGFHEIMSSFFVIQLLFLSINSILLVATGSYNDMIKSNGMYIDRAIFRVNNKLQK